MVIVCWRRDSAKFQQLCQNSFANVTMLHCIPQAAPKGIAVTLLNCFNVDETCSFRSIGPIGLQFKNRALLNRCL